MIIALTTAHGSHAQDDLNVKIPKQLQEIASAPISCDLCTLGAGILDEFLERNATTEEVISGTIEACTALKIEQHEVVCIQPPGTVCVGIMNAYVPIIYNVLIVTDLTPAGLCDKLRFCTANSYHGQDSGSGYDSAMISSIVAKAATPKPTYEDLSKQQPMLNQPFTGTGYILHLADIHFDASYKVGSNPNCGRPLCCRDGTGDAGVFGHYLCDIPLNTVNLVFEEIVRVSETIMPISMVVWTGDNPPHDVWMQSEQKQVSATEVLTQVVQKYFPTTPVFPSIGNHEAFPADQFILPEKQWLLDSLNQLWAPFLPADQLATVQKAGYYTLLVQPGLRVISLNTQDADMINFYNYLVNSNQNIPNNQTDWFINTLEQAETNNEKVIIIGHIPCTLKSASIDYWCEIYQSTVERFTDIISAQFYGHTHYDQLVVFSDVATHTKPTGMNYVAPSMTTYQDHEPGFRIYEYNFDTAQVTNFYQFHTNLSDANLSGNMTFSLAYSAKELYDMPDLSPASWWNLANSFKTNSTQFDNYYKHIANAPQPAPCNKECQAKWTCEVFGVTSKLFDECLGL
eukprot:gene7514-8792_t